MKSPPKPASLAPRFTATFPAGRPCSTRSPSSPSTMPAHGCRQRGWSRGNGQEPFATTCRPPGSRSPSLGSSSPCCSPVPRWVRRTPSLPSSASSWMGSARVERNRIEDATEGELMEHENPRLTQPTPHEREVDSTLLHELVGYLRENRDTLSEEWARRITDAHLLHVMTAEEIFSEVTAVYDNYVTALETGSVETLQAYARDLSERIIPRGVETHEVLGIVLLLRDVLARSLFANSQDDPELLGRILDAYEPAANRIAVTVGVSFVEERERVIREQQEAIRELSTPVLQVRDRLLILPIIGVLDSQRARQLTEQLLGAIQTNRAKVVVIDITGVATIDVTVADHLVQ